MRRSPMTQAARWMRGMMHRHMPMMITCREFEDFIAAYLDGDLADRRRRVFELHIRFCRECRDYLAAYRRTMAISRRAFEAPDEAVPDDVPEDLIKAILAARDA